MINPNIDSTEEMSTWKEASISIEGTQLSIGQVMTLRVAMEHFASFLCKEGLGDDERGKEICARYMQNVILLRALMGY